LDKEQRESRAKSLLSDELFNEAFNMLEQDIKDTWYRTSLGDTEAREQAWLSLRLLERIRLHLTSIIESGDMARKLGKQQL
jgi:hypothetical protein